jgi:hypothetical protein
LLHLSYLDDAKIVMGYFIVYNEKLIITICEGIHLPLEFCDTCPYCQRCPLANTKEAREKSKRLEKLFDNKDFFSEEISNAYNIPSLPVYVYDNPHTMYEKLGFCLGEQNYDSKNNAISNSMFSNPLIIIGTSHGPHIQLISEERLNMLIEKLDGHEGSG